MCLSHLMPLVKVDILLVNADTSVKLNLLKSHDFLYCLCIFIWINGIYVLQVSMWLWARGPLWRPQPHEVNKHGCLAYFSIKKFYTWSNVVEITFYHCTHT